MKERPILFSAPMVRAILEGRKTMTRRVVKDVSSDCVEMLPAGDIYWQQYFCHNGGPIYGKAWLTKCPYGKSGDRLWVRESWKTYATLDHLPPSKIKPWGPGMEYLAGGSTAMGQPLHGMGKSRPSISMPRWASRIDLEITGVRIERLNQISNEDILREGIRSESCNICVHTGGSGCDHCLSLVKPFRELWDSINGKTPGKTWDDNPFVWVVEFKRGEK